MPKFRNNYYQTKTPMDRSFHIQVGWLVLKNKTNNNSIKSSTHMKKLILNFLN